MENLKNTMPFELTYRGKDNIVRCEDIRYGAPSDYFCHLSAVGAKDVKIRFLGEDIAYNLSSDFSDKVSSL